MRAGGLRPSRRFSRSPARGGTRAARICLVILACLAQLWMPAQHRHSPGIAAHSMVHQIAGSSSGVTPASFDGAQSSVPARYTAPVAAPTAATALRLATTAIAPSARAPAAARRSTPRWAFCRRRRRGPPMRRRFPQLPRPPCFSARSHGSRLLPGSPARLQS